MTTPHSARYQCAKSGCDFVVIDTKTQHEVALCNEYDGQADTPRKRAKRVCAALNAADGFLRLIAEV